MLNFACDLSTKIYFGKDTIVNISEELKKLGVKNILLVYGQNSLKQSGIYEKIIAEITKAKCKLFEFSGVVSNPVATKVREGIEICKDKGIDFILAAGGGSVLDTAKAIAAGAKVDNDFWDFYQYKEIIKNAIPMGSVITLAATGSEMNGNSVITNLETKEKNGVSSTYIKPVFSILDPTYTFSVSKYNTAAGIVDIIAHVCEQYFSNTPGGYLNERLSEGIIKTCIHYAPIVFNNPTNYEARANLLWAGTLALNELLSFGRETDWASHAIEHQLSAQYNVSHGAGLSVILPHWIEYVTDENNIYKFMDATVNIWAISKYGEPSEIAQEGVSNLRKFFKYLEMPLKLEELGITNDEKFIEMAKKATQFGDIGFFKKLNTEDVLNIYKNSWK